jgi:hypothetical protein
MLFLVPNEVTFCFTSFLVPIFAFLSFSPLQYNILQYMSTELLPPTALPLGLQLCLLHTMVTVLLVFTSLM